MSATRLLLVAALLAACDDFDELGDLAECNNQLPSCSRRDGGEADGGVEDAGAVDAGSEDAGGIDAGDDDAGRTIDAGPVDAGPADAGEPQLPPVTRLTFASNWSKREQYWSEPHRSVLVGTDAGLVLWFVSTYETTPDAGWPPYFPGGYIVAVEAASGLYLTNDGGLGSRDGNTALSYQAQFHSPANVAYGKASFSMTELLLDGGRLLLPDGGPEQRAQLDQLAEIDVTRRTVERPLVQPTITRVPLAAGVLTHQSTLRHAYVAQGATGTQLVLNAESNLSELTFSGFPCTAHPDDVVTTITDGGDRLLTLSRCPDTRVLAYSATFPSTELQLGLPSSARMAIAAEGTPGRAPYVALTDDGGVRVYRLDPAGVAVAASNLIVPRGSLGLAPVVEALAVDELNRPVVVLSTQPLVSLAFSGLTDGGVTSSTRLFVAGLAEDLSVRWVAPLQLPNAEPLRATAAAITGGRLVLALECDNAGGFCGAMRAPTLSLVGVSPGYTLP